MPRIINFGSINIDHVYQVDHFVQPGETLSTLGYSKGLGGKGLNQTVALQRAGARVVHVGCVGRDDEWMMAQLTQLQLNLSGIAKVEQATGHALIQVNREGENCILLHAGANHSLTEQMIDDYLAQDSVEWVLLQNETNLIEAIIDRAHTAGKRVAFNPAPCHVGLAQLPLEKIDTLVVNEIEALQLTGTTDLDAAVAQLRGRVAHVVLTMGGEGVRYVGQAGEFFQSAQKVQVVDTTAAGDTFIGYYLASLMDGMDVPTALLRATKASAITVTRAGASSSIPVVSELDL